MSTTTRAINASLKITADRSALNKQMKSIRSDMNGVFNGAIFDVKSSREALRKLKEEMIGVKRQILDKERELDNKNLGEQAKNNRKRSIAKLKVSKNELALEISNASRIHQNHLQDIGEAHRAKMAALRLEQAKERAASKERRRREAEERASRLFSSRLIGPGIGFLAARGARRVIEDNKSLEKSQFVLKTALGDADKARAAFERVKSTVKEFGSDLDSSTFAFSQFAAATKGTSLEGEQTFQIFRSISKQAAVTGANIDDFKGVFKAIRQIATKGKVQAEELVGQLGERIPGAINLMAEGLGITQQALFKLLETGKLSADKALPALMNAINKSVSDEEARGNVSTLNGMFNLLQTSIFELTTEFGQGGANELIKEFAKGVINATTALKPAAKLLGILAEGLSLVLKAVNFGLSSFNKLLEITKGTALDTALSVGVLTTALVLMGRVLGKLGLNTALGGIMGTFGKLKGLAGGGASSLAGAASVASGFGGFSMKASKATATAGGKAAGRFGAVSGLVTNIGSKLGSFFGSSLLKVIAKRLLLGASGIGLVALIFEIFTGFSFFDEALNLLGKLVGYERKKDSKGNVIGSDGVVKTIADQIKEANSNAEFIKASNAALLGGLGFQDIAKGMLATDVFTGSSMAKRINGSSGSNLKDNATALTRTMFGTDNSSININVNSVNDVPSAISGAKKGKALRFGTTEE